MPAQQDPEGSRTAWWPAAAVVAGLVLAALLARPANGLLGPARGVLTGRTGLVMLLVFACAVGGARLASGYRADVRGVDGLSPRAERLKDATRLLLPGAAVLLPLLLLYLNVREQHFAATPPAAPYQPKATRGHKPRPRAVAPDQHPAWLHLLSVGVELLVIAAALIAALVWLGRLWRARRRPRPGRPPEPVTAPAEDEQLLADAVSEGRRALHGTDARAAVIACYAAMERSLADSGIARRASDSPADLLARAAALTGPAAEELTALFREARYSTHPMDDGHLSRARTALDAIAARLGSGPVQGAAE